MLELDKLKGKAVAECLAHVEQHLEGMYWIEPIPEPADESVSWDASLLRYVYDIAMVVWRRYGQFEVVLDADDKIVGYVDHDKWLECRWEPLADEEALAIARASGLVRSGIRKVKSTRGERDCLELMLELVAPHEAERLQVRINPARRAIISILPVPAEES
jgi:hypothetical protein